MIQVVLWICLRGKYEILVGVFMVEIGFSSDHAGYDLKEKTLEKFGDSIQVDEDLYVPINYNPEKIEGNYYPVEVWNACMRFWREDHDYLMLYCGSGMGVSEAARIVSVRLGKVAVPEDGTHAREDNDYDGLTFGEESMSPEESAQAIQNFLGAEFKGTKKEKERHLRRVNLLREMYDEIDIRSRDSGSEKADKLEKSMKEMDI